MWSYQPESNRRPHPYQGCALPTEPQQQISFICFNSTCISAYTDYRGRFSVEGQSYSGTGRGARIRTSIGSFGDCSPTVERLPYIDYFVNSRINVQYQLTAHSTIVSFNLGVYCKGVNLVLRILALEPQYLINQLEQVKGIEPSSSAWKADIMAIILHLHRKPWSIWTKLLITHIRRRLGPI